MLSVSISEIYAFFFSANPEVYEHSLSWTEGCILHFVFKYENWYLKSANNLKCNDDKYVVIWLSKWLMNTNSDLGLVIIPVNQSLSKLSSKILDPVFF